LNDPNKTFSNPKRARFWHVPSTSSLNYSPQATVSISFQFWSPSFPKVCCPWAPENSPCRPELTQFLVDVVSGVKHKLKAAEKEEQRQATLVAQTFSQPATAPAEATKASPVKEPNGKKTPKDPSKKKEKAVISDAQGNELKRPLSAYMLYNNHRRPTLRAEHPGKIPSS
jgi:hypothetical protein